MNSLSHTVKYKNHSVGYIFHTVGYKSHTLGQRNAIGIYRKRWKRVKECSGGHSFNKIHIFA